PTIKVSATPINTIPNCPIMMGMARVKVCLSVARWGEKKRFKWSKNKAINT
ncbi:MAG: hypothetical protein RIT07_1335, partial [Bacteroidota bacterium]